MPLDRPGRLGQTMRQATSEDKREKSKGCRVEEGRGRGTRSGEVGAAVRPAILSNKSLEPTEPSRFVLKGAEEEEERT